MFKKNGKYFAFLGMVFAIMGYVQYATPTPTDWKKTFDAKDKIPLGCKALYDVLESDVFNGSLVSDRMNIYKRWNDRIEDTTRSSSIFINDKFNLDEIETGLLLNYVSTGNKVLLAAGQYNGPLADSLNLNTNISFDDFFMKDRTKFFRRIIYKPFSKNRKTYSYDASVPSVHFTSMDTAKAKIIAVNEQNHPVIISQQIGKGTIYLVTVPEIFTNHNFVYHPSRDLVYKMISYLKAPVVHFDGYYKTYAKHIDSDLAFIFNSNSLYAAYITALLVLLVFMVFNAKRKQRAVPIVVPPSNSTIDFVEVIGNVYYHSKNHKSIAEEMILSFLEMIRGKFQVNTYALNNEALIRISTLSGIDKQEVDGLFAIIERIQQANSITEQQLIGLYQQIEQFNLKNKR